MSVKYICQVHSIVSPSMGVISPGFITWENGVIKKITDKRSKIRLTKTVEFFSYPHAYVFPGFVEAHSHVAVMGEGIGGIGRDANEVSRMICPDLHIYDSLNLDTPELKYAREEGIMGAAVFPGSANLIGGLISFIRTTCPSIVREDAVIKKTIGYKMALGENPKRVHADKVATRMGCMSKIREYFAQALEYQEQKKRDKNTPVNLGHEATLGLFAKNYPARIHAHQASDIQAAIELAEEYDFDVVIEHGTDSGKIVDYLAKKKVPVVCGPIGSPSTKVETKNRSVSTPAQLVEKDILTGIMTDAPVYNIRMLRYLTGMCIKNGMDYMDALRAITINAAKICQVDDLYGDLRPGFPARFALWSADPLKDMQAQVEVMVDGDKTWGHGEGFDHQISE